MVEVAFSTPIVLMAYWRVFNGYGIALAPPSLKYEISRIRIQKAHDRIMVFRHFNFKPYLNGKDPICLVRVTSRRIETHCRRIGRADRVQGTVLEMESRFAKL